jgi:hypothetical protein
MYDKTMFKYTEKKRNVTGFENSAKLATGVTFPCDFHKVPALRHSPSKGNFYKRHDPISKELKLICQ